MIISGEAKLTTKLNFVVFDGTTKCASKIASMVCRDVYFYVDSFCVPVYSVYNSATEQLNDVLLDHIYIIIGDDHDTRVVVGNVIVYNPVDMTYCIYDDEEAFHKRYEIIK